jgi:hypothetical protein
MAHFAITTQKDSLSNRIEGLGSIVGAERRGKQHYNQKQTSGDRFKAQV